LKKRILIFFLFYDMIVYHEKDKDIDPICFFYPGSHQPVRSKIPYRQLFKLGRLAAKPGKHITTR